MNYIFLNNYMCQILLLIDEFNHLNYANHIYSYFKEYFFLSISTNITYKYIMLVVGVNLLNPAMNKKFDICVKYKKRKIKNFADKFRDI